MSAITRLFDGSHPLAKFLLQCGAAPPPGPDYTGAAIVQGQANIDAARTQGKLNTPNVISPYGTQTVAYGTGFDQAGYDEALQTYAKQVAAAKANMSRVPGLVLTPTAPDRNRFILGDPDQATITQRLRPAQQALLDKSNLVKSGLSDLAIQGTDLAQDVLGQRLDYGELPARPGSAEETRAKVVDAMMARVNEDVDRQKNTLNSNLYASGIPLGSKAYDDAMALTERARTDARNQALLASGQEMSRDFQTDTQRRRDTLAELLTARQTPINEIAALMSGSQVSNPFSMPGYAQNATVAPAPLFAAQNALADYNTDIYNARAAGAGNLQSGLFGLGGAAIMGAAMF